MIMVSKQNRKNAGMDIVVVTLACKSITFNFFQFILSSTTNYYSPAAWLAGTTKA
jgi:hypothetical protein